MNAGLIENVLVSRRLVVQSKRLMLASAQRRATATGSALMAERVERLRSDTQSAYDSYRESMLSLGSPSQPDYWPVAYSRLIEVGQELAGKLRRSVPELAPAERYRAAADVEMLEHLVNRWTASLRASIAAA